MLLAVLSVVCCFVLVCSTLLDVFLLLLCAASCFLCDGCCMLFDICGLRVVCGLLIRCALSVVFVCPLLLVVACCLL